MNLGIESTALGFTAGFTGDEIIRRLEEMGVRNGFIQVGEGFSRINLKLKSIDGTEINGQDRRSGTDKVDLLMKQLRELGQGDVLFLSGSIPSSMPDDAYQKDHGYAGRQRRKNRSGRDERSSDEGSPLSSISY